MITAKKVPLSKIYGAVVQNESGFLREVHDGDLNTFWSVAKSDRESLTKILIYLPRAFNLSGLVLHAGKRHWDFPRGVKVSVAKDCLSPDGFKTVFALSDWTGPIKYTKQDGLPYYGSQSHVAINFPSPEMSTCVLIEQIRTRHVFDWVVAEIDLSVVN